MRNTIVEKVSAYTNRVVLPFVEEAPDRPLLAAVRSALILCMPLMLLGSFAVLLNSFPLAAYKHMMQATFGPNWRMLGDFVWNGTFAVMSLVMSFCIGQYLAEQYNANQPYVQVSPLIGGLVAMVSLCCLIEAKDGLVNQHWTGVSGLFVALVTALCAGRFFLFLFSFKALRVRLPGGSTDLAVLNAANAMFPGMITVLTAALLELGAHTLLGMSLHEAFYVLIRTPFIFAGEGLERALLYVVSLQGLWFFGIHGTNALEPVTPDVYGVALAAAQGGLAAGRAALPIISKTFMFTFVFMGGAGVGTGLVAALFLFGETQANRKLAGFSLVPGIFNINEVLLFGLPVILNPFMLIPFILAPLICVLSSYAAMATGLVPTPAVELEWTTPVFLNGYLATGSIRGTLLQMVNIALCTALYAPFVLLDNRFNGRRLRTAFRHLLSRSYGSGPVMNGRCTDLRDDAGYLARGLVVDLEEAPLSGRDLYLEFQPQVSAATGRVKGVEALLRWNHPYHGPVPAPITVSLMEESGLVGPLGLWIFDQACSVRKVWLNAGIRDLTMSINVSVLQLEPTLPDAVMEILRRHALPTDLVEIEVTESSALNAASTESAVLTRLHGLGLRIAIDDFGMGHSSLKYLNQFPVSTIKIDGAISREVATNPICMDMVKAITRLCQAQNMLCVAEFVETDVQAMVLRDLGVDLLQGYRYSRPLVADACLTYILENFARPAPTGQNG